MYLWTISVVFCISVVLAQDGNVGGQVSGIMGNVLAPSPVEPVKPIALPTPLPKKHMLRRKVVKVVTTTEEDEEDCRSHGGTPCIRDDQCCLGKCNSLGRCPTAKELFDAAAALKLQKERENLRKNHTDLVTTESPAYYYYDDKN